MSGRCARRSRRFDRPPRSRPAAGAARVTGGEIYWRLAAPAVERALSRLDAELTSPSRGSFDRTWWAWKFTDFSASRFQEGVHVLAWLATSPHAPEATRESARLADLADAAIHFWAGLQHADGSFDEAYPFERSLAATAFTGFYVGSAIERLGARLAPGTRARALAAMESACGWLARNDETHGVLSNHLAAAAACLEVGGALCGTDRFRAARDRFLGVIWREQDPEEGWLREYGGADPGYQSHALFYLADIWRRSGDADMLARIERAVGFSAWFVHPDGTVGGEYASRGTKFGYPAGFEMLANAVPLAGAVARHLRATLAAGRGVGVVQMDAWNLFPLLNNYLFAIDHAGDLSGAPNLPWAEDGAEARFPRAGIATARRAGRVVAVAPGLGGTVKLWEADGRLAYEDSGYALAEKSGWAVSQGPSAWRALDGFGFETTAGFARLKRIRFDPWRFVAFRLFTTTVGRAPAVARALKNLLVRVLIRGAAPHRARLVRTVRFHGDGTLEVEDSLTGLAAAPVALARHVPWHMGSARYTDLLDAAGAAEPCPPPEMGEGGRARRTLRLVARR